MNTHETILKVLNTTDVSALPQKEQRQLADHLESCPSCREHQRMVQLTSAVIRGWEIPEVSSQLAQSIFEQTEHLPQEFTWSEYWSQSRWFPATAVAAFAMSLLLILGSLSLPAQQHTPAKLIKQRFALLHGPSLKYDKISMTAGALGLELE